MARPVRAGDGAARKPVTVRMTEVERSAWVEAAAAAGLTVSDWVRAAVAAFDPEAQAGLVRRRPPRRRAGLGRAVPPSADPAVVAQLARLGNNLNQIARFLHATGGPFSPGGLVALRVIERRIDEVLAGGPSEGAIPAALSRGAGSDAQPHSGEY
ncbi:MAG TPA: plasmid mobilization relaxosome protein MobC [Dermatophilaceae bacterium]|nr:plasmid mobilization relaxosome protein MobC [Dermatophilaceae bacterium]